MNGSYLKKRFNLDPGEKSIPGKKKLRENGGRKKRTYKKERKL